MRLLNALRRLSNVCPSLQTKNYNLCNYVLNRNFASSIKIKWVRPVKVPAYDQSVSGDLTPFQMPEAETMRGPFASCELIHKTENENVKKVFSIANQSRHQQYFNYKMSLINKVKSHQFDDSSLEVKIAQLTARIRILQYIMPIKKQGRRCRKPLNILIHRRRKYLKALRAADYKKFEWLLEVLDLKFYPDPIIKESITRKKSTKLLAELKREKMKELGLAECKKKIDQEKVPFLEKKLKMLKHIKEQEAAFQLEQTVSDTDIENCIKQIEKVKIQVENNKKKGYMRKVHPYTLELYNPKALEKSDTN